MRTASQRIAKYNARMVSSQLDPVRAALVTQQQAHYAAYATEFYPKQQSLRAILDAAGIDPAQYVFYEAFNGEMYHIWKTASGASAITAAGAVVGRWAHASRLGVGASARLKQIANTLYSIVVP
jgi:FMN-dependent NADH-azoreductase